MLRGFVLVLLMGLLVYSIMQKPNSFELVVDDVSLGFVESKGQIETIIEQINQEKEIERSSSLCVSNIDYQPTRVSKDSLLAEEEIVNLLQHSLIYHYGAIGIAVDGDVKVILEDKQVAEQLLEDLKQSFLPSESDMERYKINILKVETEEQIEYLPLQVEEENILAIEEAMEVLKFGQEVITYHTVESGNSLWSIAHANGLTVEDLKEANPELTSNLLKVGQKIRLVKPEPMLNVQVSYEQTGEESIAFKVNHINTDALWRGQQRVQQPGVRGSKEVTYLIHKRNGIHIDKIVVEETILSEPKTQVVSVGTKIMTASRGGGGSGLLGWPLRGSVTSGFGYRTSPYGYRNFHSGVDISGRTGDPIFAAEAGVVIFSGWQGGYGNLIIIDHGDGVSTYYAHASQRLVQIAAQVKRGDLIAKVGSTGNSTGPHLHFEVRVNGNPVNPMNYLRD